MILSVCIQIKNRSLFRYKDRNYYLFPNCIDSLVNNLGPFNNIEIVIADWESTDWPIREWIGYHVPKLPVHLINIKSKQYSRGKGRNIAAQQAKGDIFFFLDGDMLVPDKLIETGMLTAKRGTVAFPIAEYAKDPENVEKKEFAGFGNLFIQKEDYYKIGFWPEYYGYGWEDVDYYKKIKEQMNVQFLNIPGFIHQWHPQDLTWKDKYAERDNLGSIQELRQVREKYKKLAKEEDEKMKSELLFQLESTFYTQKEKPRGYR